MAGDVLVLRERRPGLPVVPLSDGAPEMHRQLDESLCGEEFGVVLKLIDSWHRNEEAHCHREGAVPEKEQGELLTRWRLVFLKRRDAFRDVLLELKASGKENKTLGNCKPVHDAITCLENNHARKDFVAARKRHLPIRKRGRRSHVQ
jgi:hypothetical protein